MILAVVLMWCFCGLLLFSREADRSGLCSWDPSSFSSPVDLRNTLEPASHPATNIIKFESSNIIKYHASGSLLAGQSFEASSAEYDSIAISFCVKSGTKRTSSKKKPVDLAADLAAH